jgi:hypothetical protein
MTTATATAPTVLIVDERSYAGTTVSLRMTTDPSVEMEVLEVTVTSDEDNFTLVAKDRAQAIEMYKHPYTYRN